MTATATPPRTIPPRVRLEAGRPPVMDTLLLLALLDLSRTTLRSRDVVYSFGPRMNG